MEMTLKAASEEYISNWPIKAEFPSFQEERVTQRGSPEPVAI